VGAVPVTAVVTEIEYGPRDRAEVVFKNGSVQPISVERIHELISESENLENFSGAGAFACELVGMGLLTQAVGRGALRRRGLV
jgi:hypothetical protein